jgi:hypothetical protein
MRKMFYTLFTTDGEVKELPKEPTPKIIHELLDCKDIEEKLIGIKYNGKDHHDSTILIDDMGCAKEKPLNQVLNKALKESTFWRNREYIMVHKEIVIVGDAIVVTNDSLINPDMSIDNTVDYNPHAEIWNSEDCIKKMMQELKRRDFLNGGKSWSKHGINDKTF